MSALSLRGRFDAAEGPGPERGRAEPRREKPCKKNTAESFDCFVHAFSPHMVITRFFKRNRAKTPLHFFIGRRYPRRLRRAAENIIPPAAKAAVTASGEAEEPHPPATFSEPLSDPADE